MSFDRLQSISEIGIFQSLSWLQNKQITYVMKLLIALHRVLVMNLKLRVLLIFSQIFWVLNGRAFLKNLGPSTIRILKKIWVLQQQKYKANEDPASKYGILPGWSKNEICNFYLVHKSWRSFTKKAFLFLLPLNYAFPLLLDIISVHTLVYNDIKYLLEITTVLVAKCWQDQKFQIIVQSRKY